MKNRYLKTSAALTVGLAVALASSSASATTYRLQAASGHAWAPGEVQTTTIASSWANIFSISDGRTVGLHGFPASGTSRGGWWINPLPIEGTNTTWYAYPSESGDVESRICSFYSNGNLYGCGSLVTGSGISSVTVPNNGNAYVQSYLFEECVHGGPCSVEAYLRTVRVYD